MILHFKLFVAFVPRADIVHCWRSRERGGHSPHTRVYHYMLTYHSLHKVIFHRSVRCLLLGGKANASCATISNSTIPMYSASTMRRHTHIHTYIQTNTYTRTYVHPVKTRASLNLASGNSKGKMCSSGTYSHRMLKIAPTVEERKGWETQNRAPFPGAQGTQRL